MNSLSSLARRLDGARTFTVVLSLLLLVACDPGHLKEGLAPSDTDVVEVSVAPAKSTIAVSEAVLIMASAKTATGQSAPAEVDWTSSGGTLVAVTDSSALFSATTSGSYLVKGRGRKNPKLQDSTVIVVSQPISPIVSVSVSPASANLPTGASLTFLATATRGDGSTFTPSVTWSATGGTISSGGLFTAGNSAGNYRVTATEQTSALADTSTVTLATTAPVLQAVVLSPLSASVATRGTQQFSVTGQWSDGSTTAPSVSYSATGGTITAGGLYTAGSTAGTFLVIAAQQGGTLADTSVVTLSTTTPVLQAVILTPATVSLTTDATQQFGVTGQWSDGATTAPSVTYSATGGTITSSGLYTAGSTAGSFRVIAVQQGGTLADTSAVTVTLPVLQGVILTPSTVSLASAATQQFTVSGQWSNGATTAPSVTYSATGGTITSGGLYTAGSTAGTFRVIAVHQGGSLADTATINIAASPPPTATIYFEDGFESGGLGGMGQAGWRWGQSNGDAGYAPSVSSLQPKTGARSLRFAFRAGPYPDDAWSEQRFVMGGSLTEVYVRFWLYIPSNYAHRNTPSSDNNKFFRVWATNYAAIELGSSLFASSASNPAAGSDLGLEQSFYGGSMGQYNLPMARGFISPADYGTWMRVQLHFKLDTGSGNARMRVWKNYTLVLDSGNFANPAGPLPNVFTDGYILGWSNSGFDALTTLYVDDFVMSNYPE